MERQELEDIVLKSVYFARFFTDKKSVKLEECAEKALKKGSEKYMESQKKINNGKYGPLVNGVYKATNYLKPIIKKIKGMFTGKMKSFTSPSLNTSVPQQRREAQFYLNEIENFYNRKDKKGIYLNDLKEYLTEIYSLDFNKAFGALLKEKVGLTTIISTLAAGSTASCFYANHLHGLRPPSTPGMPPVSDNALLFATIAAVGGTFVLSFLYFLGENYLNIKAAKKMFAKTKNTKELIEKVTPEELENILSSKKNKIQFIMDADYGAIKGILKLYRKQKNKGFNAILGQYMQ